MGIIFVCFVPFVVNYSESDFFFCALCVLCGRCSTQSAIKKFHAGFADFGQT